MLLSISEKAANKVKQMAAKQNRPEASIRLSVVGGGCSGLSYQFGFINETGPKDKVFEEHGVKVVVDPKALLYIAGSQLDYEETIMKSGFKVKNPNATVSCSCGESFSV